MVEAGTFRSCKYHHQRLIVHFTENVVLINPYKCKVSGHKWKELQPLTSNKKDSKAKTTNTTALQSSTERTQNNGFWCTYYDCCCLMLVVKKGLKTNSILLFWQMNKLNGVKNLVYHSLSCKSRRTETKNVQVV